MSGPLRKKRKPDSVRLNLVSSQSGSLRISRLSIPIQSSSIGSNNSEVRNSSQISSQPQPSIEATHFEPEDTDDTDPLFENIDTQSGATRSYRGRQTKLAEGWLSVRDRIFDSIVEQAALPSKSLCNLCGEEASVLCCQCGPYAYYCMLCAKQLHMKINLFHTPLCWQIKERIFKPMELPICLLGPHSASCYGYYYRQLTCIGGFGLHRDVNFCFCACHSEAETLARLGFFPSTPKHPSMAFQFLLLDKLEAFMLECQVPLKDFLAALNCYSVLPFMQPQKDTMHVYKALIDIFEEYRYTKNELRHLKRVCVGRGNGTECPACPKNEKSTRILSIDGNFGLCRKKAAGQSVRPPLHNGIFFEPQEQVDSFVQAYKMPKSTGKKECSDFLAGDIVRSKSRYATLDETGVLGVACRHEFPFCFFSLRHGERISYIVHALEKIKSTCNAEQKVLLLYDVGCTLKKHLQGTKKENLLNFFTFAVPVFHSYGHIVQCQLSMSPRHKEGFGLTDGEVLERLWSFLRRFSKMTKEMRPSHRVDILTDALLHYSRLSSKNLKYLLPARKERAIKARDDAKKELKELIEHSPVSFNEDDICDWLQLEQGHQSYSAETPCWTTEYFSYLQQYYHLCDEVTSYTSDSNIQYLQILTSQVHRLERKIQDTERKHNILRRWTAESSEYKRIKESLLARKKDELSLCARDRWFMLSVRRKFADGQYMASRISRLINKQTDRLKKLISAYNKAAEASNSVTWEEVTNLESSFWVNANDAEPVIPRPLQLQAINTLSKFHRAVEELGLLDEEMINVLVFHLQDHGILTSTIRSLESSSSDNNNGYLCLLKLRLSDCTKEIKSCIDSFSMSHSSILTCITSGGYLSADSVDVLKHISDNGNNYIDQGSNIGSCLDMHNNSTAVFHSDNNCIDERVMRRALDNYVSDHELAMQYDDQLTEAGSKGNWGEQHYDVEDDIEDHDHSVGNWGEQHYDVEDDIEDRDHNVGNWGGQHYDVDDIEDGDHNVGNWRGQHYNVEVDIEDRDHNVGNWGGQHYDVHNIEDYDRSIGNWGGAHHNVDHNSHMSSEAESDILSADQRTDQGGGSIGAPLRYWLSDHDDYDSDNDQLEDLNSQQWYQKSSANSYDIGTQSESEYDHDDEEEEEEFIREGIENALRAKERLEKAEFLEKQKKDEDVESILNLFSEQKSLLVAKRPQFDHNTDHTRAPIQMKHRYLYTRRNCKSATLKKI